MEDPPVGRAQVDHVTDLAFDGRTLLYACRSPTRACSTGRPDRRSVSGEEALATRRSPGDLFAADGIAIAKRDAYVITGAAARTSA